MASAAPAAVADVSEPESSEARTFLNSLLGKSLRLHVSDGRMFAGEFKCTDNDCNIILGSAYEYRQPSPAAVAAAAASAAGQGTVRADMTSRFMGLVVVPGKHITKIEAEA